MRVKVGVVLPTLTLTMHLMHSSNRNTREGHPPLSPQDAGEGPGEGASSCGVLHSRSHVPSPGGRSDKVAEAE